MCAPGFQYGPINFKTLGAHMAPIKDQNVSHNPENDYCQFH
jgi:hypothetical protein